MSNYGRNFGFRRSGEDAATREGRIRVPKTGDFRQGMLVEIDPANPGFLKKLAAGEGIVPGVSGLLIQHDGWIGSIHENPGVDSRRYAKVRNGRLATIWSAQGVKIWVRNTPAETKFDDRAIDAVTVITATGLTIGSQVEWDGDKFVVAASGTPVGTVTATNGSDYAEIALLA